MKVPFSKPSITWREKLTVLRVLMSGQLGQGSEVQKFENEFADYVGSKYAVAVSSGTDALFLALAGLGIGPDFSVIVPSLTFTSSASVIKHRGAEIVFADVSPDNLCLDWQEVQKIRELKKIDAVITVDLTGNDSTKHMPVMDIPVVIDSAHRLERGCHKRGQIRTYSFHPTKQITTGFGGMVTTDDEELAKYLRLARMHGCFKRGWDTGELDDKARRYGYEVLFPGWKMNMNNIQAAIGRVQLRRLDTMNAKRAALIKVYRDLTVVSFKNKGLHILPKFIDDREAFLSFMAKHGIECSVHFEPLHLMKAYKDIPLLRPLPNTELFGKMMVSLPLFPEMTKKQVDYVARVINRYYGL